MSLKKIKKKICSNLLLITFIIIFFIVAYNVIIKITSIYYIDVYNYMYIASDIAETGNFLSYTSRGFPFIWFLSFSLLVLSPVMNSSIIIFNMIMLFVNLLLYSTIYLTIKQMMNQVCAFFSAIFILINPIFIEYSFIAYLEPFSLLMGWLSLFLIFNFFKTQNKLYLIIGLIFSLISGFTRFEMFIVFTVPIIIVLFFREMIQIQERRFIIISLIILILILFFLTPIFMDYYNSITRFNIIERVFMGLENFNIINHVFLSLVNSTDIVFLDTFFGILFIIGFFWMIFSLINSYKKFLKDRNNQEFYKKLSSLLYLLVVSVVIIITITFFGYTYSIENGIINIVLFRLTRSLMLIRSLIIPLFIYGIYELFSNFFKKIIVISQKNSKLISHTNQKTFLGKFLNSLKTKKFAPGKIIAKLKKKDIKLKFYSIVITTFLLISISFAFIPHLWIKGIRSLEFGSKVMGIYDDTSQWVEESLGSEDLVFFPQEYVFYVINPAFKENGLSYDLIWENSGIVYKADTTSEELEIVRNTLIDTIKENHKIKYLVVDWMSSIRFVFNLNVSDELYSLIFLTQEITGELVSVSMLIYEVY